MNGTKDHPDERLTEKWRAVGVVVGRGSRRSKTAGE